MQNMLIPLLKGYIKIRVRGSNIETLLNLLVSKRFFPWNIVYVGDKQAEMHIIISDFLRIRPLLKQTGCRVHVLKRYGLPFVIKKWLNRKVFTAGMIGFVLLVYLLSLLVWDVKVEGYERFTREQILTAAKQQGIYPLQWKFRLKSPDELSRSLQNQLPGTAWIGVSIHGTQVHIKIVESRLPEEKPLMNPRHLVATKNAVVTEIFTETGRPMVQPNSYVRQGDILISGLIGAEDQPQAVVARGSVKGLVWYVAKIEAPLVKKSKVYSGELKKRGYLLLGHRGLQLTGYGKVPFEQYETVIESRRWHIGPLQLPFGWLTENLMEAEVIQEDIDVQTAKNNGMEQARADILIAAGEGSRLVEEKVLHEKAENGKVYMEVHFEVEEYIMQELPIIHTQGE